MLSGEGGGRMEDKDFLELIISERMGMHHDTFKKEYPLTEKQAAAAEICKALQGFAKAKT